MPSFYFVSPTWNVKYKWCTNNILTLTARLAVFITYAGLYVPFFYVASYGNNIGVRADIAFYLLIILNAASILGRILPPFVADK